MMGFDVRRFDIYRKVPKDLTQPTLTGALISVTCCLCIFVLIVSELNRYLAIDLVSTVYVDNPSAESRIPVFFTVELPRLKCEYIGLDIQDDMGRHEVGFVDNTEKTPFNDGEGCIFEAKFQINKVPGNFHISTHAAHNHPENPDFSHRIIEVRMGEGDNSFPQRVPGSFNPLHNLVKEVDLGLGSHDYQLRIVPTVYETNSGEQHISYQYTYAYRNFVGRGGPAIWFRYDLSPLTVKYNERGEPLFQFLTAICAVVGGVFTVAGIIDGLVFSGQEIFRKFELGKQS